jgi:hypothetical protein
MGQAARREGEAWRGIRHGEIGKRLACGNTAKQSHNRYGCSQIERMFSDEQLADGPSIG